MMRPTQDDIRKEFEQNYGHVVGRLRRLRIRVADLLFRIARSAPLSHLQKWYESVLKREEGVPPLI